MTSPPRPDAPGYPVVLQLDGRRCLVVGGGAVAARRAAGLAASGARVHVVAPEVSPPVRALASVTWEERPYRPGDLDGCRLAVAATDRADVNDQVAADGERSGVLVNRADLPSGGDLAVPAVWREGPLIVAVTTGGTSPGAARAVRDRVAELLAPELDAVMAHIAAGRTR